MRSGSQALEVQEAGSSGFYNIGQAAGHSGVSAKMIRHYESLGLMRKARRTHSNYRVYSGDDLHTLRFIKRARNLGFSIKEINGLLGLWQNKRRESQQVKHLAQKHIEDLDHKIKELVSMRNELTRLVKHCHGDQRPDCPIIDDLGKD
jgi:Cu(I)-responsive transcriptional regulator